MNPEAVSNLSRGTFTRALYKNRLPASDFVSISYRMPIVCRPLQLMGEIEYEG